MVIGTPIDPSSNRRNNAVDRVNTELEIGRANFDPSPVNGEIAGFVSPGFVASRFLLTADFRGVLAGLAMRCATLVASSCIDLRYEVGCPSAAEASGASGALGKMESKNSETPNPVVYNIVCILLETRKIDQVWFILMLIRSD